MYTATARRRCACATMDGQVLYAISGSATPDVICMVSAQTVLVIVKKVGMENIAQSVS